MEQADQDEIIKTLVDLTPAADLNDQELEELRNLAAKHTGCTKRTISAMLKAAQRKQTAQRAHEEKSADSPSAATHAR